MNSKILKVQKTSELAVELSVTFGIGLDLINKHFESVELNYEPLSLIIKGVKYGSRVSDDLKNFVRGVIVKNKAFEVVSNDLHHVALAYNEKIGYFEYNKAYEATKYNYISIIKNKYGDNVAILSIKGHLVDKSKIYFILSSELMNDLFFNDFERVNELYDRKMIKDLRLKVPKANKGISYELLAYEYEHYDKQIKVNHEAYYLNNAYDNAYDPTGYARYLVTTYTDYNTRNATFEGFLAFLENKGVTVFNDQNKGYEGQINLDEYVEHELALNKGYELVNFIYYNQVIDYIEKNYKGYDKRVFRLKELRDGFKFDKTVVAFLFKGTAIYQDVIRYLNTL